MDYGAVLPPSLMVFFELLLPWSHFPMGVIFEGYAKGCLFLKKTHEPESLDESESDCPKKI